MTKLTKVVENEEIEYSDFECRTVEDVEFRNCYFKRLMLKSNEDGSQRSVVRNVKVINCKTSRSTNLNQSIFDNVVVENLKCEDRDGLLLQGNAFRHVRLVGPICDLRIVRDSRFDYHFEAISEANRQFYAETDWALDISQAQFRNEARLLDVPARLIIRDPQTQVLVTRERAESMDIRSLGLEESGFIIYISMMLNSGYSDVVVVAPIASLRRRDVYLEGIDILRNSGLAVPEDELDPIVSSAAQPK